MRNLYFFFILVSNLTLAQYNWTPLTTIPSNGASGQRFDDVFFLDENIGWAANGGFGDVYKTIDGGATWTLQANSATLGSSHYFRNIEFLNANIGFLGTLNNKFYKTVNGGTTWTQVTNIFPNPPAICGLDCVGTSTIYGCGAYFSPAYVIKSTDSGATWQYINMSTYADALVEVLFIDENTGFVSGNNENGPVILKTTNGGTTWTTIYNGTIPGEYVWKLQILASNPNVMFGSVESVAPNPGRIIKSVNNGVTWTSNTFPDVDVQAIGFTSETHGWMGGHHTGFYETNNSGATWTNLNIGSNLNRIFFVGNIAYASGTTIYKMSNTLSNVDFEEQDRVPLKVRVSPNPIKDKLNLEIDFIASDHLRLGLYSIDGKFIKQLILDEIASAETKKYTFDFPYPNGTYIVNLHTNTGRQSVKVTK
ncbi:T9SS type A sorting domain-containing protein [Flavobacterium sp.]|uniref:T9SS type A sorting domain-containing protein n=1 Tax=Flavobacterium sp. TaxID=239 RepID=UPI002619287F|nr:T9SS type A sorting domain-containing protein [Flavobacterium sp.]